jgi:MoxR-like ATPase
MDDVIELAAPILRHRMSLNFSARADGIQIDDVITKLIAPYK